MTPALPLRVLDVMTGMPAIINNGRLDLLAADPLGRPLFVPVLATPARPANHAQFTFLDPRAPALWLDREEPPTTPSPGCPPRPAATPTTTP